VIKIKVYTILTIKKILGKREFEVSLPEGSTVKDLLSWMIKQWGESLASHLFQPGTYQPLPYIRFMVNGRLIEFLNGLETILKDGDEFLILPVVAGG
jgi:molybdopterin synthase sulfur carrier subunit